MPRAIIIKKPACKEYIINSKGSRTKGNIPCVWFPQSILPEVDDEKTK